MGQRDDRKGDLSHDQLIQDYLEHEATPYEEQQFRLLLGEKSFGRRVAQFAIDLSQLNDLAQQGMLARLSRRRDLPRRLVFSVAAVAAAVLIGIGLMWTGAPENSPHTTDSAPVSQAVGPKTTLPPVSDPTPRSIAQVEHVVGVVVRAASLDAADGEILNAKAKICSGDVLRTIGPDSFAVLQFVDKTIFAVGGDSELECAFDPAQKRFVVIEGHLLAQVTRQSEGKPMVFETPHAEAEVLGTTFSLFADSDMTELAVQNGEVRMHRRSDNEVINVRSGQTLVASANSQFVPQPLAPIAGTWEENFDNGLPRRWRAGRLVDESLPSGSFGVVRAVQHRGAQGDPGGPFRIATSREWARGLFRVEPDTHLNFTFRLRFRGGFHVRLNTHTNPLDPRTVSTYEYRNRALRGITRRGWRTVSVPLQFFGETDRGQAKSALGEPPSIGNLAIMVSFGSPGRDPGLLLDRIWVTHGAPESAELLGESE